MHKPRRGFRNISVQADLKCQRCFDGLVKPVLSVEVAIQTELSFNECFFSLKQNGVRTNDCNNTHVVANTQGKQNRDEFNLLCTTCNSFICSSCKYVNKCLSCSIEEIHDDRTTEKFRPSSESTLTSVNNRCIPNKCEHLEHVKKKKKRSLIKNFNSEMSKSQHLLNSNSELHDITVSNFHNDIIRNCDTSFLQSHNGDKIGHPNAEVCTGQDSGESDCEPLPECDNKNHNHSINAQRIIDEESKNLKRLKSESPEGKKRLLEKKLNYVKAGLYSDDFKHESAFDSTSPGSKEGDKMFPRPIHFGRHLMKMKKKFVLPYDIWFSRNRMKKMKMRMNPSLNYKKIRDNIYVDIKPTCKDSESSQCNCLLPGDDSEEGCADNCLNRMVYTECVPDLCACGDRCGNQRIQKHQSFEGLQAFLTEDRGYGVRALRPLSAGQFIMEYVGEVVSEQEFRRRMTDLYSGMVHHYCLSLDSSVVIDGYRCGNVSRLVNHSCSPNCEMQKWNVGGVPRIGLFAIRDIGMMEELTYDYNFHAYNVNAQQECKCGSSNCRKVVSCKGVHPKENQVVSKSSKVGLTMSYNRSNRREILHHYSDVSGYDGRPPIRDRKLIRRKVILLMRNLSMVRRREGLEEMEKEGGGEDFKADVFKAQFTAINTSRSVKTRQLTKGEDSDVILRMSFLAQVFMQVFNDVINCKDECGSVALKSLYHLPSKRKFPTLYVTTGDPVDLSMIKKNIGCGKYSNCISFHEDFAKFFDVAQKIGSDGTSLELMRHQYFTSMEVARSFIETIGDSLPPDFKSRPPSFPPPSSSSSPPPPPPPSLFSSSPLSSPATSLLHHISPPASPFTKASSTFHHHHHHHHHHHPEAMCRVDGKPFFEFESPTSDNGDDDVIRCVCGVHLDEGVMLQCESCQTWQHQSCMNADVDEEDYLCYVCTPRKVSKEVPLTLQPKNGGVGCLYHMTLMRGDLQLRVGESVYVTNEDDLLTLMTSLKSSSSSSNLKDGFSEDHLSDAYKKLSSHVEKLDLFKIENLWIDGSGRRLMHGHYFLRPHEIYHDHNQKFNDQEVLKATSLSSTLPVVCAVARCCVMDVNSYVMGRPRGFSERDVYVCEFRVDKNWRTIKRPLKFTNPINKARFCFNRFVEKATLERKYMPHLFKAKQKPITAVIPLSNGAENGAGGDTGNDDDDRKRSIGQKARKSRPDQDTVRKRRKLEDVVLKLTTDVLSETRQAC